MKYIPKDSNREPESVKEWKRIASQTPNYGYKYLPSTERLALLKSLVEEQKHICCYCGMRINDQTSHVEHLIPQSSRPDLSLDYTNLLASCGISQKFRPEYETQLHCKEHCGQWRGNDDLPIKPIDPDCETKFHYTERGEILPNDDRTVLNLNLNHKDLTEFRKAAIFGAKSLLEGGFSNEEIALFAKSYERPDRDGKFRPFCFAIAYFLNSYI